LLSESSFLVYRGIEEVHLDMMSLPINGRNWFRERLGLVGNMDDQEVAELAAEVGVRVLFPNNNKMFAGNRINLACLVDYLQSSHPNQRVHFI
jgi:L-ascorbate 6-phosphate lactonase